MVLEARRMVDANVTTISPRTVEALNSFGYDDAAQWVYGMEYEQWKQRHMKPTTAEQLQNFNDSRSIHAQHDTTLLQQRSEWVPSDTVVPTVPLSSNVCCVDVDPVATDSIVPAPDPPTLPPLSNTSAYYVPPAIPSLSLFRNEQFPVTAILTVSDRAYAGVYPDEGGPAVATAIRSVAGVPSDLDFVMVMVPDDAAAIQAKLQTLADQGVDLIWTTGGTGLAPRDVTPEATAEVVDYELSSLVAFCMTLCAERYPHQTLSRGTAGILNSQTVVCNLPGHPKSIAEMMPIVLPLILHVVADVQHVTPEILHIG
jgi:molybdopterin adenylyltransferase